MPLTPSITFRGFEHSDALEADILARARKLQTYYPRATGCHVLVELLNRHHESGNRYHVRIEISVPGEQVLVSHEPGLPAAARNVDTPKMTKDMEFDPERKFAHVAVREAFEIARRRLQDYARRQRGAVKTSARPLPGRVSRIFPIDEYGYLEAEDGHEVYFQATSVLKGEFDRLVVGSAVSFIEEPGEKGPQASTVKLLHPRRVHRASHAEGARLVR